MKDVYAALNGHRLTAVRLTVGNVGPWVADCDFEADPDVGGRVALTIGELKLSGTVVEASSGVFGMQRRVRVVAGAAGWSKAVDAKQYHNDAGVKARLVAEDAARAVGETFGDFVPAAERIGRDYAREAGPASRALESVLGGAPWHVDYEGTTRAGPRATTAVDAKAYTVLAYDPRDRIATLAIDDPGAVRVGSIIGERLGGPQTVRSLELRVNAEEMRILAWCGGNESAYGHLSGLLRAIVQRTMDGKLWGHYRYRVVRMAGDRVELQAVRKAVGLPDLLPLSVWPGVAGAHAELAPGAEVLVVFLEGDRAQPVVVAFAGADGVGFVPAQLTLGGPAGSPVARQGDTVEVQLGPAALTAGLLNGQPFTGTIQFAAPSAIGLITSGSSKVRVSS